MAAQENHIDVVKYLLENGANQSTATEVSGQLPIRWSQLLDLPVQPAGRPCLVPTTQAWMWLLQPGVVAACRSRACASTGVMSLDSYLKSHSIDGLFSPPAQSTSLVPEFQLWATSHLAVLCALCFHSAKK